MNIFIISMPNDLCDNKMNKVLSSKKFKNPYPVDVTICIVKYWQDNLDLANTKGFKANESSRILYIITTVRASVCPTTVPRFN